MNRMADSGYPVIWGVSANLLLDTLRRVRPEFAQRARIELIEEHFENAVAVIQRRLQSKPCDAIVTAGANTDYLRARLDPSIPIIPVRIDGFDIMRALVKAGRLSDKIGVVLHKSAAEYLSEFVAAFPLPAVFRFYDEPQESRDIIAALAATGIQAIVGAGVAVNMAERLGIAGVFVYSRESVRLAVENALDIITPKLAERSRYSLLNTVLRHLNDGVIAVDTEGRLVAANEAAETLAGCDCVSRLGQRLHECIPALAIRDEEENPDAELSQVVELAGRSLVVNRSPLYDGKTRVGRIFTLLSPNYVERAFNRLRAHTQTRLHSARYHLDDVVAASPQMKALVNRCTVIARHSEVSVLLIGPTGVGKELFAQGIHNAGARRAQPFRAVNCGAFPETLLESELFGYEEGAFTGARRSGKPGLFEAANKGTVFFDEIAELPLALQTRLLRVLQEREVTRIGGYTPVPVDIRIIAASHQNLFERVQSGTFREDLFYRISGVQVVIPPLAARPQDLALLAERFLALALDRLGLVRMLPRVLAAAEPVFREHAWPGNVRELENVAERLALICLEKGRPASGRQVRDALDAPRLFNATPPQPVAAGLSQLRAAQEKAFIRSVVDLCGGSKTRAAERLGVSRATLWRKLREAVPDRRQPTKERP